MRLKRKDHKGQNGKVLVVGGSEEYVGAPALAGLAALKTGVDVVTICAPEKVAWVINSYSPDLIVKKFIGREFDVTHCREIINISKKYDVVLLGPGLGINKDFVLKLLRNIKKPFVIDADALKVININIVENSILTPHAKEFEILYTNTLKGVNYSPEDQAANIKNIKKAIGSNVILLKGKIDTIFSRKKEHQNKTGNPGMTVGGTGDVLAGLCAGFLAQSGDLFDSAKEAAFVNGKTGDFMLKQRGYGYTASDIVSELHRFIKIY